MSSQSLVVQQQRFVGDGWHSSTMSVGTLATRLMRGAVVSYDACYANQLHVSGNKVKGC